MQFFKKLKKNYQTALAEETTDIEFDEAEKNYFNVQRGVERLMKNVEEYEQAWDRIVALRNQLAGDFLFFYGMQTANRDVGDSYMKMNRSIFGAAVHDHQVDLKKIVTQIRNIRQQFLSTQSKCKERQETRTIYDRKRYALSQFTSSKKFDKEEAARKHEKMTRYENQYLDSTRDQRAIFSKLEERKDHFIDKPFEDFLAADAKMIESVFKNASMVKDLRTTLNERTMVDSEAERLRIKERGDSTRRRVSTWTQNRIDKMKQEFHFVQKREDNHNTPEYYFKSPDKPHPLEITIADIVDFEFMHDLLSPHCKKHPRSPKLDIKPSKVKTKNLNKRVFAFREKNMLVVLRTPRRTPTVSERGEGNPDSLPVYMSRYSFGPEHNSGGGSEEQFQFLEFAENERLYLIRRDVSGWLFGQNDFGEAGWFPETFVEKVMDERQIDGPVQTPMVSAFDFHQDTMADLDLPLRESLLKKSVNRNPRRADPRMSTTPLS